MIAPSIGDVLGAAGEPPTIVCNGKTWKIGYPTQAAADRLEKLIVADALASAKAATTGDAEFDAATMQSLRDAILHREYRTSGKLWTEAFSRQDGQMMFYLALIREHHPEAQVTDVAELMIECPEEFLNAIAMVSPSFFFIVATAMGIPPKEIKKHATLMTVQFNQTITEAKEKLQKLQQLTTLSS